MSHRRGGGEAPGLKHHPKTPHPEKQNLKYTDLVDTMISKVICDLHFSLNQPSKSADDSYTGISKSIIKLSWICRLFPFQLVLIFPCNLTKCRLWDFDIILVKHSVKSNKLYIATGSAHLPPPPPPPPRESRAVYEIMFKNVIERGRPQMTIWRMRIACWIPKATDTHSEYVILIAFLLQQCLQERLSIYP